MQAVDTNLLVRLLTLDDSRQVAAARSFIAKGGWISTVVLAEATWVLESRFERTPEQLQAVLALLLRHETLVVQDSDAVAAALAQFRAHPGLGFSDCLILELARKAGHLPLGTFDIKLSKLEGAVKA